MVINIGILAHVDAGKTSLTEQILFHSNNIENLGSVDKGSTSSDTMEIEKKRGISIQSSVLSFLYKNTVINIIDTPGHIDFVSEVDRSLKVLDIAIIVVSAVDGVQAQTIRIFESLNKRNIPTIFFINKIDRVGTDLKHIFLNIKNDLGAYPFLFGDEDFEELESLKEQSVEILAEKDESFLESYISDKLLESEEQKIIVKNLFLNCRVQPLFVGSAKNSVGINNLLNNILFLKPERVNQLETFSASVFKIVNHNKFGLLYGIKNYGINITPKSKLKYKEKNIIVNKLYKQTGGKFIAVNELSSNDIAFVSLSEKVKIDSILGELVAKERYNKLCSNSLIVRIQEKNAEDYSFLAKALEILNIEDPELNFVWNRDKKHFNVNIQGEIQIEILKEILLERFSIPVIFNSVEIQYKETPKTKAEGFVRYWMPKPCWAIMKFSVEPGERGSGVVFKSEVSLNDIQVKYQNEIKRAIPLSLKQGIKGWEVTDIIITLISGEEHQVHSNPGDFILATPMGILRAIKNADTLLLEPMYLLKMKFNKDYFGAVLSELNKMNAEIGEPEFQDDYVFLQANSSVANSLKFPITFNSITSGKGRLTLDINSYKEAEFTKEKEREYLGVNPLNESQWILHNRGAFKADSRKL